MLAGLQRLADRIGQRSVLLATDDAGAIFLAEYGRDLRRWFLFPDPPADLPRRLAGKYSLHEVCREFGIPSPRTVAPGSLPAAREFASAAGYPLIAKLTTPWRPRAAGSSVPPIVASQQDLTRLRDLRAAGRRAHAAGIHPRRAWPRLVLPRVLRRQVDLPAGLYRRQGTVLSGHRRTDLPRAFGGKEGLRDEVTTLLAKLGYRGILDLDIRLDERTGDYHLLDFNPRLGAQFRVFRDTAGTDVALAAYLDLTDQPIPTG